MNQSVSGDTSAVEIALIGEVDVHGFREERNYIVDIGFDTGKAGMALSPVISRPATVAPPAVPPKVRFKRLHLKSTTRLLHLLFLLLRRQLPLRRRLLPLPHRLRRLRRRRLAITALCRICPRGRMRLCHHPHPRQSSEGIRRSHRPAEQAQGRRCVEAVGPS